MLAPLLFLSLAVATEAPVLSDAQLDQLCAPIYTGDAPQRLAAAQKVAALGPDAYAALVKRLARPPKTSIVHFRKLFLSMWGQVPNWKSGDPMWIRQPEPRWTPPPRVKGQPRVKRPPPHDPETLDWLTALDTADLDAAAKIDEDSFIPPPPLPPGVKKKLVAPVDPAPLPIVPPPPTPAELQTARAEAMETVAIMRAISNTRRLDAVEPLFSLAFQLEGVFRDECGRQIRAMDSFAVPELVRLMHRDDTKQQRFSKQRRYASYQLDRMDRARPSKAIATAPDDRVKAEIIHAYGETRALDAVESVLNQVDSPAHRVRREARWTWLRYVTGKAPPPAPKRKRKLQGGHTESEEKPDYLTYREIALLALQKQLQAINDAPVDPNATAKQLTDELFTYYDDKHAAEWSSLFDGAHEKEARGDLKGATDDYGWILAHDPGYTRRAEMAPAFAHYADSLRDQGDIGRALGYWRQAIDLAPNGPDARYAAARVALYDGQEAVAHGHPDVGAFRRALALDPTLEEARRGIDRAEALHAKRRWLQLGTAFAAALALGLLLWLLWRKTAPPRPTAAT
ncbi:MAG TPA: hypothetical protein VIA18_15720 [Polyangia bacterium]|nr:hypothetical protein [Polyangia bacterium]